DGTPVLHFRIQRGKRGARNFVAHNSCWLILERLRQMVPDFAQMTLQQVLKKRVPRRLFCLPDGSMPESFNKPFKALLEEAKLLHCLVTGKEGHIDLDDHQALQSPHPADESQAICGHGSRRALGY
ncbi:MAG: hypothetical protein EBT36_13485, partial [Betaproteobacteria bacterium]|nr:hypothetical protein [Betaproteobacteria bacterium]